MLPGLLEDYFPLRKIGKPFEEIETPRICIQA